MEADEYGRYWKTILETMADGLMVVSTGGVIEAVNPAMEKLTGYSREELLGRSCRILGGEACGGVRGEEGGSAYCRLFDVGQVRGWRCNLVTKDGRRISVMKNATVLTDEKGAVLGGVENLADLGEMEARDRVIRSLRGRLKETDGFHGMIGTSAPMRRVYELLSSVARSDVPVVIAGESGTGKELAARAIHRIGPRAKGPFVAVNCAALNEELLESELFGHVKGAFTGADRNRTGRFEAAQGGDIFLDEIGDMPPSVQVKLLRVLEEREIERVGENRPIPIDARVIAATNRDLNDLIEKERFRRDLYYRIGVFTVRMPPLRERAGDIPLLVEHHVENLRLKTGKAITGVGRAALARLVDHSWPGNVRELVNVLSFAFVVCPEGEIEPAHLPDLEAAAPAPAPAAPPAPQRGPVDLTPERILDVLRQAGGNKAEAARRLGVSRVTLWSRLKKMDRSLQ